MPTSFDPSNQDELTGVDLSRLNLDDLDLEADTGPSPWWRPLVVLLLVGLGAGILWLPNTDFYRSRGENSWLFFAVTIAATLLGIIGGRWLWQWGEEAALRYAARRKPFDARPSEAEKPASPARRWLTLLAALGGTAAIVIGAPDEGYLTGGGNGYSSAWFLAAGGAVAVGVLIGRFILMHSAIPTEETSGPPPTFHLPPWWKWVTLGLMIVLSLFALFGTYLFSNADPESVNFSLGGVGFIVGILAAIWLARRFDETEKRLREQTRR